MLLLLVNNNAIFGAVQSHNLLQKWFKEVAVQLHVFHVDLRFLWLKAGCQNTNKFPRMFRLIIM